MFSFLLLFFQHLDDDRDSDSEEIQLSSIDLLLETSEAVSFIITLTFIAVMVKLSNFGNAFFYITHRVLRRKLKKHVPCMRKMGFMSTLIQTT
jgi:hypothetical protein